MSPTAAIRRLGIISAIATLALTGCGQSSSDSSTTPSTSSSSPAGAASADITAGTLEQDYAGTFEQPPTSGPTPVKDANVWVVVCSKSSPGCNGVGEGAAAAGKALGWKVTIADGNYGMGDGYSVAIRQAVAAQATAIVVVGADCAQSKGGLQEAKTAGVPVVAATAADCADRPLFAAEEQMNSTYSDYETWWKAWGAAKARWLIDATDGKAQVLDTNTTDSASPQLPRVGFDEQLATCSGCKIVATVTNTAADFQTGVYAQKISAALVANPSVNAIQAPLDTMLLAGNIPAAVAATGRKITVVGGEAIAPGLGLLKAGKVDAEVGTSWGWLGYGAVDAVNRVLNKADQVPQGVGWQTIDAKHTDYKVVDGGYETSVDYVSGYLKLWGLK